MVKLTERLVLARSRASSLENVRKLNCWASDLTDVSIIQKMANVQIVSLSVNRIESLEDFADSMSLEELYIRKNNITNLAEIFYLRGLPRLRVLWLADNPCAMGDCYRMTVLKTLPNLQRLDSIPVQDEELNEAIEQGLDLTPLAETLKSMKKSTPESSPEQCRRAKSKAMNESENTEEKESEMEKEEQNEKVLLLEDDSKVEKELKESKEDEDDEKPEVDDSLDVTSSESENIQTQETESTESLPTETVTSRESGVESVEESGEKGRDGREEATEMEATTEQKETSSSIEDGESEEIEEDIEEGEVTIETTGILIQETNDIRTELGLKPLAADKTSQPTHSQSSHGTKARNSNILQAVLHLVRELDEDSLQVVADVIHSKLESL